MTRSVRKRWTARIAGALGILGLSAAAFAAASGALAHPKASGGCCSTHGSSSGALADFKGISLSPERRIQIEALENDYHDRCGKLCASVDTVLSEPATRDRERRLAQMQEECAKLRERHRDTVAKLLPESDRERYRENAHKNGASCKMEHGTS